MDGGEVALMKNYLGTSAARVSSVSCISIWGKIRINNHLRHLCVANLRMGIRISVANLNFSLFESLYKNEKEATSETLASLLSM